MSKHGPCELLAVHHTPAPAVAWCQRQDHDYTRVCRACLDAWFDAADTVTSLEPLAWGWLNPPRPSQPDHAAVTAWARDPRNHREVAAALRLSARIDPSWLREFLRRDERMHRRALV